MTSSGLLLLDKPIGISSAKALYPVKKLVGRGVKVGHAGTLDPFASGLLVVAVGRETTQKLHLIVGMDKVYDFTVEWGEEKDTDDLTGVVTRRSSVIPSLEEIEKARHDFIGFIDQEPPRYSAINLEGKRAYELARNNIDFKLQARKVRIDDLIIVSHQGTSTSFSMTTGKGCYVRSVARDLARKLGSCGHVTQLRRTRIGKFRVENATVNPSLTQIISCEI